MFSLFASKQPTLELPAITLYNTLTRSKETFTPLSEHEVLLYSCGPTVYDYVHIGNLRAYVFVDTLKRTLLYNGYHVNHTLNYTDFGHLSSDADTGEDKMMKGLKREGLDVSLESMNLLAEKYIRAFENDSQALRLLPPTQAVRASAYLQEQIKLIETLEEKGYTYTTSDGVYFDVTKYHAYGKLGNVDIDAQQAGARIAVNNEKRHPADFALWKNGELGWSSKWGTGFPGWHIECSAMAFATLGKQIDIHTGGIDHIAIHHNAEIAQCECASGKSFANYWLHNNFLNIDETKIAKSTGNGIVLHELIDAGYSADDFRYLLLQTHYRSLANFSYEALQASQQALHRIKEYVFRELADVKGQPKPERLAPIIAAMNDDLNTPQVIAELHTILKDDSLTKGEQKTLVFEIDSLLGIGLTDNPHDGLAALGHIGFENLPADIKELVARREAARAAQNWSEADQLRDALALKGYDVTDTAEGTTVTKT